MIEGQFNVNQVESLQEPDILQNFGCSVRTFEHSIGNVVLAGHCLSTDEEILETLDKVVASKDEALLTHLTGSYVTAVSRPGKTTIYSDLAGQFPVYFTQQEGTVHYGTLLDPIARRTSGMPDKIGLALELAEAHSLNYSRTRYAEVCSVPPAQKLELSSDYVHVSPYELFRMPDSITFDQAAENVRLALHAAIAGRIATGQTISGDFSGGLDSTSLAFLTLAQLPRDTQFHAFHSYFSGSTAGDVQYAKAYAALDDRIDLHLVELPKYQYSFTPGKPLKPVYEQHLHVQKSGSGIHLDGTGSDALFNVAPAYLYDMWHQKGPTGIGTLLPAIVTQARLANDSPREYVHKVLTKPRDTYEDVVRASAQLLKNGELPHETQLLALNASALSVLSTSIRRKLASEVTIDDFVRAYIGRADRMALHELWASGRIASRIRNEAGQHNVSTHFPFLDHQVIRAAMQIPGYQRHGHRQFKALLRVALQDEIPDEILQRRSKGGYSSEVFEDVRLNALNFRNTLDNNSLLARLGIISPPAMHRTITDAELGLGHASLSTPTKAVEIEQWLRSRYRAPLMSSRPQRTQPPKETAHPPLLFPISLAPHARAIEDRAGIALYNLRTKELRSLHYAAGAIVRTLHGQSRPEDVYEAVRQTLQPGQHHHQAESLTAKICTTLMDRGFMESQSPRSFAIATPQVPPHPHASEVFYAENVAHSSEIKMHDYFAVMNGIRKASKLLNLDLYEVAQRLGDIKNHQQWSDELRVKKLLHTGHVIGKYYMGRLACQELSLAVVLAEAQRGRRVDWALGISTDPRRIHAWPEIKGQPVRTEYDDFVTGKYTKLDAW